MANLGTLYRFRIGLSDIERGVYADLDFRIQMHPSETPAFLLTRVLAYALNYEEALAFAPGGLSDTEAPALQSLRADGSIETWIEVGQPNARKLHRASKCARKVSVYCSRDPSAALKDWAREKIHRSSDIQVYSWEGPWLESLAQTLAKDNRWTVVHSDGALVISAGEKEVIQGNLKRWTIGD